MADNTGFAAALDPDGISPRGDKGEEEKVDEMVMVPGEPVPVGGTGEKRGASEVIQQTFADTTKVWYYHPSLPKHDVYRIPLCCLVVFVCLLFKSFFFLPFFHDVFF